MEPANGMDGSSNIQQHEGSNSPPSSSKRQRAKQACEPCRLRKRRCDGNLPCNMCTQFEYKCYFEKHPRKRSKLVEAGEALHEREHHAGPARDAPIYEDTPPRPEPVKEDRTNFEDQTKVRSMEANSSIAFTRLLGLRLDPSSGPKLFTFGWNLGSGEHVVPLSPSLTDLLGQDQMYSFARLYFLNVHILWGFLEQRWVMEQLGLRWARPEVCRLPDHMLAGIAALGHLWSNGQQSFDINPIVSLAKLSLENTSTMQPPSLIDVQSWMLRTLYLRCTYHPHATWMASCTTMHLVESTGIHQEKSNHALHSHANDHLNDSEIRGRTFWVARMLNTWVSFEYGRTRVALRGITCQLPSPREGDFTTDYVNLYSVSCCLDPERLNQASQWEDFLRQLEDYEVKHDGIMLSKANIALCGYRRIRLSNPALSADITNRIISIGLNGLEAARRLANEGQPWWHVANVPFQAVCVFLAMDVRESLAHISNAVRTLEEVTARFPTVAMKEALKTARFLIRLSKKRKDEDSGILGQSLRKDADCDPRPENLASPPIAATRTMSVAQPLAPQAYMNGTVIAPQTAAGAAMLPQQLNTPQTATSEDWSLDILNNSDFDWNYFLTADMPAFQSFAPDGTM
ncbi:hypothetical protein LTR78_004390 [Recurvomyces mirabilis]|uniref:Zn(2)-C6 fungal-type domain-containing protein n=1 Tax=Recurvomyces mirabilis TaxID=574656 RepID=A0AAE0WQ21_9PEZI|nr:hypothetical protein LTR78_004390 [Recurvomyces mirabilis]KAK5155944.1 hypothetical protein LTS14_005510 [Recurvomyces mirabilis]